MRTATIAGKIPTMVIDSGASSTCVKPPEEEMQVSECGEYAWDDPLTKTGEKSDKIFAMALVYTAEAGDIMECNALPLRSKATRAHTIPGLQINLGCVSQLVSQGYIPIFDGQRVGIYDSYNTKITVSRAAVLEGWYVPKEKLWRIPMV